MVTEGLPEGWTVKWRHVEMPLGEYTYYTIECVLTAANGEQLQNSIVMTVSNGE